jgi:hypothetical protein
VALTLKCKEPFSHIITIQALNGMKEQKYENKKIKNIVKIFSSHSITNFRNANPAFKKM